MENVTFESIVKAKLSLDDQRKFINRFGRNAVVPLAVWCKTYTEIQTPLVGYIFQQVVTTCLDEDLRGLAILSAKRAMPILEFYRPEIAVHCRELLEYSMNVQSERDLFHKVCQQLKSVEKETPPWFVVKAVIASVGRPSVIIRSYHTEAHNYALRAISGIGDFYPQFPLPLFGNLEYEKMWQLMQLCNKVEELTLNQFAEYRKELDSNCQMN